MACRVAQENDNCHFLMVGDGPKRNEIQSLIDQSPFRERFHLVGKVGAVSPWFKRMDLFLMTSEVEGLPNVALEAQAHGLPVVTTNAGGCAETIVEGKSGWSFPLSDEHGSSDNCAKDLSKCVSWCINNPQWCRHVKQHADDHIEKYFSVTKMINDTIALYQSARI